MNLGLLVLIIAFIMTVFCFPLASAFIFTWLYMTKFGIANYYFTTHFKPDTPYDVLAFIMYNIITAILLCFDSCSLKARVNSFLKEMEKLNSFLKEMEK